MAVAQELSHPDRAELSLTQILFALSDPARIAIARQLVDGSVEMAGCVIPDPNIPKATKSHIMKVLREAGVIRNKPQGRNRLLSLRRDDLDARFPGLIDAILSGS